jgi:ATP-dependent protease ClpP protease subunit
LDDILIDGFIVNDNDAWIYRWFGMAVASPSGIRAALKKANGAPVTVRINSPGGETWSASVIYTDLREYAGDVTAKIVGLAASAASVIAMAGDVVQMSPTAEMMIHNPWTYAEGDYREMDHASDVLRNSRETIINAYALKSKTLTRAEIGNMLNKETWLDAQKALGLGLIDSIMFDDGTLGGTEPAPSGGSEPMPGGKAAAANIPSAAALKERKRV